jgi:hypothetical protein
MWHFQSIQEALALHSLGLLAVEQIPEVAMLFLDEGCDVLDMAALAGALAIDHPADLRSEFERAVRSAGRAPPTPIQAAQTLRRIYAQRGSSGTLSPREAAGRIVEIFRLVEQELPAPSVGSRYLGEAFRISGLIGSYYALDDVPFDDAKAAQEIERELCEELARIALIDET